MTEEKRRIKAVINNETYTIIGAESQEHMTTVAEMVEEQLQEIKTLSPHITTEKAAILIAINAVSDQLMMQNTLNGLEKDKE